MISYLGKAILWDSHVLAQHVIQQGCDINEVIPGAGLTPLQLSCMRQSGSMTLFLLQNGANPRLRGPSSSASCMTLLAMRPLGTYEKEIASALISNGITYATDPHAFEALYVRAVKDGWYEIATQLLVSGGSKTNMEQGLLFDILLQNTEASIGPLMFLLEPQHDYGRASPMLDASSTVFHHLAMISEDVREDDLNSRILQYLISKFSQLALLNKQNSRGNTALALAASNGNHRFVKQMLLAGADPEGGNITATMFITDRIFSPKIFGGDFAGLSRRTTQMVRYENNSMCTLKAMLEHKVSSPARTDELERNQQLPDLIRRWQMDGYVDEAANKHLNARVTTYELGGTLYIRDLETSRSRKATFIECKLSMDPLF